MSFMPILEAIANTLFLIFVVGVPLYAAFAKVKVYEVFVIGAQDGFQIAIKIIPYLVAMLVAIGMFRASGALDLIAEWGAPIWKILHVPPEILPLAFVRPFSGTAATGVMAELIHQHGGNAYISQLAATVMGSTETTFYIIAVYFGAVNIQRTRQAVPAGLIADAVAFVAAIFICHFLFA